MHDYIQKEAARMGIAQNAFLVVLLEQGKMLWEAKANLLLEVQSPHSQLPTSEPQSS